MKTSIEFNAGELLTIVENGTLRTLVESVQEPAEQKKVDKSAPAEQKKVDKSAPAKKEKPKEAPKTEETPVEPEAADYDVAFVRAEVAKKTKSGKKEEVKELLKEMGFASVTDLGKKAPDKFGEFLEKLGEL